MCSRRKSFDTWYYIVICATLCASFSSKSKATNIFPKHTLKPKAHDQSVQARKKLFCIMIVNNYLCNVFLSFWSRWRAHRGGKSKNRHPSWLDCTVVGLSEVGGVLWKNCSNKFRNNHKKKLVLRSLFNKVEGLQACNFFKDRL